MGLGHRKGTSVVVILAVVGVVGAMVAATVLVYATQAIGSTSRQTASSAADAAPPLRIEAVYLRVVDGEPVEMQWFIETGPGGSVALADVALEMEAGGVVWREEGAHAAVAVRDADGSMAAGRLGSGDIMQWVVPLAGRPVPEGQPGTANLSIGDDATAYLLNVPPLRGDQLVRLKVA